MGTLANIGNNLKESEIGLMLREAWGAFLGMVNSVGEIEETLDEAVKGDKNPETKKIKEALVYEEKTLSKQAEKRFDTSKTFGEDEKDKDGYNKIPDKVTESVRNGISVSEEKAIKDSANHREKGGKQKTRIDED